MAYWYMVTQMTETTTRAEEHSSTGDPNHVAYGQDYYWSCTCGRSAAFLTGEETARSKGENHERYCISDGTVTVRVSV